MVKQYDDGYFINGEWFNGVHHNEPIINVVECLGVDVIDGPHNRADHLYYDGDSWCELTPIYSPDNAWSTGDYASIEEPCDVQYVTYLFYAIAFLVVLAILFIIFA